MNQELNPANTSPTRYTVIPRTLTFITNASHHILLLRGAPTKTNWANLYNGIGGHIEPGETVEEAARREIVEETGITELQEFMLRGTISINTGANPGILIFVFSAYTNHANPLKHSAEGIPEWCSPRIIPSLPLVPDVPKLLTMLFPMTTDISTLFHTYYTDAHLTSFNDQFS